MKAALLALFLFFVSSNILAKEMVKISKSIVVNEPIEIVFDHVKDAINDYTWRSEVNRIEVDGPFKVGTVYTEDAWIGLKKNFITKTVLVEVIENQKAFYMTPTHAKYFLSSLRTVRKISTNKTLFTYSVVFDSEMSRVTAGAKLPPALLRFSYGLIMEVYMMNLKSYLERR